MKNAIKNLLDGLDSAANSNTFLLQFAKISPEQKATDVVLAQLQSGAFHTALVAQDTARNWHNYSELHFYDNGDSVCTPYPGTTYNGCIDIRATPIDKTIATKHLLELLQNKGELYAKSSLGKGLGAAQAEEIVAQFWQALTPNTQTLSFEILVPNFLYMENQIQDKKENQHGYFEGVGRDFALACCTDKAVYCLLVNGYA
jgi:hypothetical protein